MLWIEYGAYAGILGGITYIFLLFAFRDSLAGRSRISWMIQLEMAVFMILLGLMTWEARTGRLFRVLGRNWMDMAGSGCIHSDYRLYVAVAV